jgi:hypothetical protein
MSLLLWGQTPFVLPRTARIEWGLTPLIGAVALIVGCSYADTVTNAYATRVEAERAGAVESGWVPRGLPESARDLREAHSVEGGRIWGLFSFSPEDGDVLRALLGPTEISANGLRAEIPARIEWWPILLRATIDAEQIKSAGLQAYRGKDGALVMIVNWKQGRAYYWR